jgi:hypothetical protein
VVDFVVLGSVTGMPPRRVFRHAWRDVTAVLYAALLAISIIGSRSRV